MNKAGISAVLSLAFILLSVCAYTQPKIYSPLSRIGLGDPVKQSFMHAREMGGLYATFNDHHYVNPVNPAALSALKATSFEVGANATYTELTTEEGKELFWSGNLEYLALAMPLINPINEALERRESDASLGLLLGVQPFSRVGYDVVSSQQHPSLGEISRRYTGSGGTYQFYLGAGFSYKTLSVGLRGSYLFGNIENRRIVSFPDLESYYFDQFEDDINFKGILWRFGAQYDLVLERREPIVEGEQGKPQRVITFGAYVRPENSYNTQTTQLYERRFNAFDFSDTLTYVEDLELDGQMPLRYGLGVRYEDMNHWSVGIDWRSTDWESYTNEAKPDELFNTSRFAAGASWIPDADAISGIFKRSEYRIGFEYGSDPRKYRGEQARYYRISAGLGLPFVFNRQTSYINLGFYYGKDGVPDQVDQTQFGVHVGFTLTDNSWFVQRKYD